MRTADQAHCTNVVLSQGDPLMRVERRLPALSSLRGQMQAQETRLASLPKRLRNSWNGAKNTNAANATAPAQQTMHPLDSRKLGTRQCVSVGKAVIDAVTQLVDLMHRLRSPTLLPFASTGTTTPSTARTTAQWSRALGVAFNICEPHCIQFGCTHVFRNVGVFQAKNDAIISRTISDVGSRRCVRRKSTTSAVNQSAPLRVGVRSNRWRYCHRRAPDRRLVRTRDTGGRSLAFASCRLWHQLG